MRDIFFTLILPYYIYASFKKNWIGLGFWFWTSCIKVNSLLYGFANGYQLNRGFALATIFSYVISDKKLKFKIDSVSFMVILYFIWTTISFLLSDGSPGPLRMRWENLFKMVIFFVMTAKIVRKKIHIDFLLWVVIISFGALGCSEGLKYIISGGTHTVNAIRGISGDNNIAGIMLLTTIPLTVYILGQTQVRTLYLGLMGVVFLLVTGVLATNSRGAFVGLMIMSVYFFLKSKKKFTVLLVFGFGITLAYNLLPDSWFERMNTIEHAEGDGSMMSRVISWKMCMLIAMDNPIFGGGFRAVENTTMWYHYKNSFHLLDFIPSPPPGKKYAAHSMYFQVLGDMGFCGLFIYLGLIASVFLKLNSLLNNVKKYVLDEWIAHLLRMLQVSLFVYCISGSLVSVAHTDVLFFLFAMTHILGQRFVEPEVALAVNTKNINLR